MGGWVGGWSGIGIGIRGLGLGLDNFKIHAISIFDDLSVPVIGPTNFFQFF